MLPSVPAALRASGHRCVLQSTLEWNKVELVVNGECVYVCNINDLEFGNEHFHSHSPKHTVNISFETWR